MIARRYAKALLELAREAGTVEPVGEAIATVAGLLRDNKQLSSTLANPVFPLSQRRAALVAVLAQISVPPTVVAFLSLLLQRGRIRVLDLVAREYQAMADALAGRLRAEVVSAQPMSAEVAARLQQALEKATQKKVLLQRREDPALLGGLQVKVASTLYDGSVRSRLEEIRERLMGE